MKRNLKLKERLGALLLAVLFILQAILGLLPVCVTRAAVPLSIETWDNNKTVDYGYRFNMKFQPGITTYESFGCDNLDREAFSDNGKSERDTECVRVGADYKSGSAGMRYNNVGKDGNGNIVDVRLILMGVENAEPRYDLRTAESIVQNKGGATFAWKDNEAYPMVGFSKNSIGIFIYSVGYAKVKFQFLKHGTEETLPISGHGTIRDIDAGQGVRIPADCGLDNAYVLKDNDYLTVDGNAVSSPLGSVEPDDSRGWLNLFYNTDNFAVEFCHQFRLDKWDKSREDAIAKAGSQERWAEITRKKYLDPSGNSYCPNFKGQKYCKAYAYFDFTSYCFGDVEMKKVPEKRVGEANCTWDKGSTASKEQPFVIRQGQEFQYMIQAEVTPNKLRSFVIQDIIEDCLVIEDSSKVSVVNDTGQTVTDQFDVSVEGQKVTCSAKTESLRDENFTDNQTYTVTLKVRQRPESEISISKYLAEDGYSIIVPNHASMSYERTNGSGDVMDTETVWIKSVIPPELEVAKNTSRYEWKTGDIVDYQVSVTQTKPDVKAVNVVITDEIPACLQLLDEQYTVQTSQGTENCTLTRSGDNGWKAECPSLKYGETITICFKCQASEESNGKEWENIVTATADNLLNLETGEQESRKDMAEVWPNSPQLEIDKMADKYEWQAGEQVSYRIVVNNVTAGTIAKDVNITDIGLPQGLVLAGGTQSIEVLGVLQQVNYPVPDKKTGQAYEIRQVESHLDADENGFAFYCSCLPYSQPVTIIFHCIAQEEANGHESVNAATVKASNADEKSDDAEVYVNSGEFWIEKSADHYEWQVGEQVQYNVLVENKKEGTIARNVTVWDTDMPAGLALLSAEDISVSGIPQSITQLTAGTEDIPNQLNPELCNETSEKPVSYEFLQEGTGWRLNISDLPANVPVMISFLCTVTEEANGMESINIANVQAQNAPVSQDDAEVYVNTAVLSIDKGFQNPYLAVGDGRAENEFRVGEQVNYLVTVNNLQKGSIARNLVISDLSLPEGLALDGTEDAVTVSGVPVAILNPVAGTDDAGNQLNPENYKETVEKPVSCQVTRQGTGWIVTISDLPYQTPVTVNFHCTVQESVNGLEVVNTAKAYADNAQEVKDTSKVWVNSPVLKVEKTADKPFYKYGDIITYRIVMTQEQTGCVARNVTLHDVIDTPGVRLLKDSVVLMDENGNLTDGDVQASDDNTFLMSTGKTLIKDSRYSICDNDRGGLFEQVMYNPPDCLGQRSMIIEYQAAVIDPTLAGQKVHNTAVADSSEKIPATGEAETEVHSPILEIVKESDKKEYASGEKGYYKLTVRQLREDVSDQNIIIEDILENPNASIIKDSIFVKKNGIEMKDISTEIRETGFVINTGASLSDMDKLEVCYETVFKTESTEPEKVVNTARARGDISPEISAQHEVYVKAEPAVTPAPSVTPKPTETPRPTETPKPTDAPKPTATPKVTPVPSVPGTCPKLTPAPTKTPVPSYNGGNNGSGTSGNSGYGSSGGYSGGNGSYQSGSVAGSSKTGDARPFKTMAVLGILGSVMLAGGVVIYRKSVSCKRKLKGMTRK